MCETIELSRFLLNALNFRFKLGRLLGQGQGAGNRQFFGIENKWFYCFMVSLL
jgi:hypothetical protein